MLFCNAPRSTLRRRFKRAFISVIRCTDVAQVKCFPNLYIYYLGSQVRRYRKRGANSSDSQISFHQRKANFPMTSISNGNVVKTDPHFVEETVLKNSVWIDLFPNVIDGPSHFIIEAFDWICSWIFQPYYGWVRRLTSSLSCCFFTLHKNVKDFL